MFQRNMLSLFSLLMTLIANVVVCDPFEYDDVITCIGDTPPANAGWPAGRPRSLWADNYALCAAANGGDHVGCKCTGPGGSVYCNVANGGDEVLLGARLRPGAANGYSSFGAWCRGKCLCRTQAALRAYRNQVSQQDNATENVAPLSGPPQRIPDPPLFSNRTNTLFGVNPPPNQDQCTPGACNVNSDCPGDIIVDASTVDSCRCYATGSTVNPVTHTLQYTSSCGHTLSGNLNGRGESTPCACNTSYVSHMCCESREGLVWEASKLKLGELMDSQQDL